MHDGPVLFVTDSTDHAPGRYRVAVPAAGLRDLGVEVAVMHSRDWRLPRALAGVRYGVLSRVSLSIELADALSIARSRNPDLVLGYDIDDPLFNEKFNNVNADAYAAALGVCDVMLGSTPALHDQGAQLLGRSGGRSFSNGVLPKLAARSRLARLVPRVPGRPRIGFLSGSGTHQQHWESVRHDVCRVLQARPDVELWTIGPVDIGVFPNELSSRVRCIPFMDWTDLPFWLRQLDLIVMPNSDEAEISDTKSAVKWVEASLVRTPVIATATEPYREVIGSSGAGFLVSRGAASWDTEILSALDGDLDDVGRRAEEFVRVELNHRKIAGELLAGLSTGRPRPASDIKIGAFVSDSPVEEVSLSTRRTKARLPLRLQAKLLLRR